jgi:hypothetical protein
VGSMKPEMRVLTNQQVTAFLEGFCAKCGLIFKETGIYSKANHTKEFCNKVKGM